MRFVFPLLACACLAIGIDQFARHVHAQSPTGSDGLRLTVQGDRLIRVEPTITQPPVQRRVQWPDGDQRLRALEARTTVRLPDADPQQTPRPAAADSRPRLQDAELVSGAGPGGHSGARLVRKPDPSYGRPEVTQR